MTVVSVHLPAACAAEARAVTTCKSSGYVRVAGGRYIVQQNEWNSTARQCTRVEGTSWTITRAAFELATNGPPATYPSIFRGCHWELCTQRDPLPIRVGDLESATSSWSTQLVASGAYNVAYDLWTSSTTTPGQPDGSEIMVWLTSRGGVQPAGSIVGTARIAGATWDVWTTRMAAWNYVAYQRRNGTRSVANLNLQAFIDDSVSRGATDPTWYLVAVEAGFEIWQGGRRLTTTSFSFGAEGPRAA